MKTDVNLRHFFIFFVIVILLVIGSNLVIYYKLNKNFNILSEETTSTRELFISNIEEERSIRSEQLSTLRNETMENFQSLQDYLGRETLRLKLNFESQLVAISEQVEGLEGKVSELDVSSSDFSSIISDVIRTVVSIRTNRSQGSGVFFDNSGYILTNKHVINNAGSIRVIDHESRSYEAELIGYADDIDLAVLKISGDDNFNYLEFADSSSIELGSRVIAVGNPLGLSFSVTEGIISGLNRRIDETGVGYIQTDVSINRGNSGGPLINSEKKIVGINTFKAVNTEGIGFAIPSNVAKNIVEQSLD